jgi:phage gpG-like protein
MSAMRPCTRTLLAAALSAAALAPAACGGSDDDGGSPPATRAEFIAATDKRCQTSNKRTRALNAELQRAAQGVSSDRELLRRIAPILARGYAPVSANAATFKSAKPPAADTKKIERIRKAYDEQARLVQRLAAAAKRGDTMAFKALSEEQRDLVTRARKAARAYGFKECGSSKSDAS